MGLIEHSQKEEILLEEEVMGESSLDQVPDPEYVPDLTNFETTIDKKLEVKNHFNEEMPTYSEVTETIETQKNNV